MKTEDQCRFTNGGQHSFDPWCEAHRRSAILCQRDAHAKVERLKGAATSAAAWMWDPSEDATDQYERIAEMFFRDTGYLRPGKDDSSGRHTLTERIERFENWRTTRQRKVLGDLRAALSPEPKEGSKP